MQYMLFIYDDEKNIAKLSDAERSKFMGDYETFTKELMSSGRCKSSNRLQPVNAATTVRVRDGKAVTTHGPFAETREQLGGYYLIEAKDLDEATMIAAKIPTARLGSIEVRPVWEMNM